MKNVYVVLVLGFTLAVLLLVAALIINIQLTGFHALQLQ